MVKKSNYAKTTTNERTPFTVVPVLETVRQVIWPKRKKNDKTDKRAKRNPLSKRNS